MKRFIYRTYQLLFVLPVGLLATFITAIVTIVGCALGGQRVWGYYPGKWWSWLLVRLFLLPVTVEGREKIVDGQSYIFCPNHQGAFDIFLTYGFLGRNFKWVMKASLRNAPFIGKACESAGFIFVDNRNPKKIQKSIDQARHTLKDGMSVVVFPEGRRSWTGEMGEYKRGAFLLADELQLPVVPVTINGTFKVMPRYRDFHFVEWHPLRLTIHEPINPIGQGAENLKYICDKSREATASKLEK
ncbi:MAG: lysophospholipid acyltransferase family protein [Prevotellaceae bacterium]|nr:lysophospholipid acyltransferase family protein [Prevotellaceae bacterium]